MCIRELQDTLGQETILTFAASQAEAPQIDDGRCVFRFLSYYNGNII